MTHLIRNFIYTYLNMIPHSPSPTLLYKTRPLAKLSFRKEGRFGVTGYLFGGILRFGDQTQSPTAVQGRQPNFLLSVLVLVCIYLREMFISPMYFLCPPYLRNDCHPCPPVHFWASLSSRGNHTSFLLQADQDPNQIQRYHYYHIW